MVETEKTLFPRQTVRDLIPVGIYTHQRSHELLETAELSVRKLTNDKGETVYAAFFDTSIAGKDLAQLTNAISHPRYQRSYGSYGLAGAHADYKPMVDHFEFNHPTPFSEQNAPFHKDSDLWPYFSDFIQNHGTDFEVATHPSLIPYYPPYMEMRRIEIDEFLGTINNPNYFPQKDEAGKYDYFALNFFFAYSDIKKILIQFLDEKSKDQKGFSFLEKMIVQKRYDGINIDKTIRNFLAAVTQTNRGQKKYKQIEMDQAKDLYQEFTQYEYNNKPVAYFIELTHLHIRGYSEVKDDRGDIKAFIGTKTSQLLRPDLQDELIYKNDNCSLTYILVDNQNQGYYRYVPNPNTVTLNHEQPVLKPLLLWTKQGEKRTILTPAREDTSEIRYSTQLGLIALAYLSPEIHTQLPEKVETRLNNGGTGTQPRAGVQMSLEVNRPHLKTQLEESNTLKILEQYAVK